MKQRLSIFQGDAFTLTEVISGLASLAGYTEKLYIWKKDGTLFETITGSAVALTITYQGKNEHTKAYELGEHYFETKIFDTSDHVYTPSYGIFEVKITNKNDPS